MPLESTPPLQPKSIDSFDSSNIVENKTPSKLAALTTMISSLFSKICLKSESKSNEEISTIHPIHRESISPSGDKSNFSIFVSNAIASVKNAFNRLTNIFSSHSDNIATREEPIQMEELPIGMKEPIQMEELPIGMKEQAIKLGPAELKIKQHIENPTAQKMIQLEREMLQLANFAEALRATTTNLMDVFTLKIKSEETPEATVELFR